DRLATSFSILLLVAVVLLAFRQGQAPSARISLYQRGLFAFVLAFAAWVAVWGLFFPAQIASKLPLAVPPLHARFLGAMYLSGSAFMLLGMLARDWFEVRVVTVILAVW